jgi:hypothetical protein
LFPSHKERVPATTARCQVIVQKPCNTVSGQIISFLPPDVDVSVEVTDHEEECNIATKKRRRRQKRKRNGKVMPLYICGACDNACPYNEDVKEEGENSVQR